MESWNIPCQGCNSISMESCFQPAPETATACLGRAESPAHGLLQANPRRGAQRERRDCQRFPQPYRLDNHGDAVARDDEAVRQAEKGGVGIAALVACPWIESGLGRQI